MGIDAIHGWRFERSDVGTAVTVQESFNGLVAKLLNPTLAQASDARCFPAVGAESSGDHVSDPPE
jgi:hypothetical protein